MEFGFPVMPITGTTRKIMMKKLKMLMENRNKIGNDNRRSLGRYSSEEESDSDAKTARRDKNRRITMAAPTMQPPSPGRRKTLVPKPEINLEPKKDIKVVTTTRTTRIVESARNDYDTGSESDEVAEKYESPKESFKKVPTPSPSRLPSSFVSASLAAEAASDRLSQIRQRQSMFNTSFERTYANDADDILKDAGNTPFLSNFTKRLSQLSESPKSNSYDYKNDIIKENDVNGGGSSSRAYLNSFRTNPRGRPNTYDYKSTNQSIFKNNFVPFMVLVVAFLFFIVVAIVYLGIRSDTSIDVTATVPICVKGDLESRRYVNCILENEKKPTLNLLQVLKPELQRRAYRNLCEDNKSKPYFTEKDIVQFISANFAIKNETRILIDLHNLEVLSFFNPLWDVTILQLPEDGVSYTTDSIATDMDQVNERRRTKVTALISRHPYIPWRCYLYNTFWQFCSLFMSLTGGVVILYVVNYVFKCYKQLRQKEIEEEMALVENIIEILQTNAGENEGNYVVINHVRDMILPINERKKKQKVWARAVQYIHENESRVRVEEKYLMGEKLDIWRWLGGPNLNTSKNKSWQGQAFETQQGSVNSLPCSPTPCLKIRGMVKEGERSTISIRKAVLSKCAQQCRILHCGVDMNSKCVYLKCADENDAAVAYRNLHGWWYAKNLVTAKYLRLERYMQRFPDSPASGPPYLQ